MWSGLIDHSYFINMLKAGEVGGNMDETLDRLAIHYEKHHRIRSQVRSALAYPIVVGFLAIIIVSFLLVTVVPTFVHMFADLNAELPTITQFVMNVSQFMKNYWWFLLSISGGIICLLLYLGQNKRTKFLLDYYLLKVPLFGKLLQKSVLARMTRSLSSLFSSSVPILQALSIVENIVGNEVIARVIKESRYSLERGNSLTDPMLNHWAIPPLITQMVVIGEKTGALDEMLSKVADFYEQEVENSVNILKSFIEPLMILILACFVGTIVLAILVPMFDMLSKLG